MDGWLDGGRKGGREGGIRREFTVRACIKDTREFSCFSIRCMCESGRR